MAVVGEGRGFKLILPSLVLLLGILKYLFLEGVCVLWLFQLSPTVITLQPRWCGDKVHEGGKPSKTLQFNLSLWSACVPTLTPLGDTTKL